MLPLFRKYLGLGIRKQRGNTCDLYETEDRKPVTEPLEVWTLEDETEEKHKRMVLVVRNGGEVPCVPMFIVGSVDAWGYVWHVFELLEDPKPEAEK